MNELEINREIDKEYESFNKSIYSGDALPKDLMSRFEKAIFKSAPASHRTSSEALKVIIGRKYDEITNYEVGFMLNIISSMPLCDIYDNINDALKKNKEIEMLKVGYNIMVKGITESIEAKRETMLNINNGKPQMKIIGAQA